MKQKMKYQVIDRQTGEVKGIYKNRKMACSRRDKLDLSYGAVRSIHFNDLSRVVG